MVYRTSSIILLNEKYPSYNIYVIIGIFEIKESHKALTICPRHRAEYGIRWRCSKVRCSVPSEIAAHKTATTKGDRRLDSNQSAAILKITGTLVPVGSRKFNLIFNLVYEDCWRRSHTMERD